MVGVPQPSHSWEVPSAQQPGARAAAQRTWVEQAGERQVSPPRPALQPRGFPQALPTGIRRGAPCAMAPDDPANGVSTQLLHPASPSPPGDAGTGKITSPCSGLSLPIKSARKRASGPPVAPVPRVSRAFFRPSQGLRRLGAASSFSPGNQRRHPITQLATDRFENAALKAPAQRTKTASGDPAASRLPPPKQRRSFFSLGRSGSRGANRRSSRRRESPPRNRTSLCGRWASEHLERRTQPLDRDPRRGCRSARRKTASTSASGRGVDRQCCRMLGSRDEEIRPINRTGAATNVGAQTKITAWRMCRNVFPSRGRSSRPTREPSTVATPHVRSDVRRSPPPTAPASG